jgi:hypothetical protein
MSKVKLNNVRIAFPVLWEAKKVNDAGQARFSSAFLFPADHPCVKDIKKAMEEVAKAKWGEKAAEVYKGVKAADRLALHDGAAKSEYAGYEGNLFINAANQLRPTVVDGNRNPLVAADGKPYSGCYVNGIIELWAQDNKYGKRINASLLGVQFLRDGERLAGGSVASENDFEEIPGADDAASVFSDSEAADMDSAGNVFD